MTNQTLSERLSMEYCILVNKIYEDPVNSSLNDHCTLVELKHKLSVLLGERGAVEKIYQAHEILKMTGFYKSPEEHIHENLFRNRV